jgi:hypothetical protein
MKRKINLPPNLGMVRVRSRPPLVPTLAELERARPRPRRDGKIVTRADALKHLEKAASISFSKQCPSDDLEVTLHLHRALVTMQQAFNNEKNAIERKGRPRRASRSHDDTAMLQKMDKLAAERGERRPYTLARLAALPVRDNSVLRRLVKRWKTKTST